MKKIVRNGYKSMIAQFNSTKPRLQLPRTMLRKEYNKLRKDQKQRYRNLRQGNKANARKESKKRSNSAQ